MVLGCGGKSQKGTTAAKDGKLSAIESMGLTGPDEPWEQMSFDDKEFYMIGKVNPIMQEMFGKYDAQEFADFDCVDCHGKEMKELKFKMPAPSMYVVPPEGTLAYKGMEATFPEMVAFMKDTVTPAMAKLMGQPGMTCADCHPTEAPKPKKKKKKRRRRR